MTTSIVRVSLQLHSLPSMASGDSGALVQLLGLIDMWRRSHPLKVLGDAAPESECFSFFRRWFFLKSAMVGSTPIFVGGLGAQLSKELSLFKKRASKKMRHNRHGGSEVLRRSSLQFTPETPNNQKEMDISPNNHFLCKGVQLPYWNNHVFLVGTGVPG